MPIHGEGVHNLEGTKISTVSSCKDVDFKNGMKQLQVHMIKLVTPVLEKNMSNCLYGEAK